MVAPCWWIEDLERLRKEQTPAVDERIPLYIERPQQYEDFPPPVSEEPVSRVIIIEL